MDVESIAEIVKENGGQIYLVGGAIRNRLLNMPIKDEDYVITGLEKDKFVNLFPNAIIRGKSFNVFDIDKKEIALARTEMKRSVGHKGFDIISNKEISIEEDLRRRDITINAIAENVLTKQIIDPYGGRADLKNKVIRKVTDSFGEDPLRVYRVARFAANLEFEVSEDTIELMNYLKNELYTISKERIFCEFRKALSSNKPSMFFNILRKAEVLDVHFKEIYDLIGSIQPEKYHPEGDAYNHTMQVLDITASNIQDLHIRFASLVHDLGKGITPENMYPHHYGHDIKGEELVKDLGKRIAIPNLWVKCGKVSCKEHMLGGIFGKLSITKKVSFLERVNNSYLGLKAMQIIVRADRSGRGDIIETDEEIKMSSFYEIGRKCLSTINGKYIINKYGEIKNEKFKTLLHQERVTWMKENFKM